MPGKTPPQPKVRLVCAGKAHSKKDVCLVFRVVDSKGAAGEDRLYSQKNLKQVRVSHVYEVETAEDDSTRIHTQTIRWIGVWPEQQEDATWQAAAAAFDTLELAKKAEKKETERRLPLELLRPLRDEYFRTNPAGRLAIEVRVLAYLRMVSLGSKE
jgi:hypothetical protein